jgi:hypothetical protein
MSKSVNFFDKNDFIKFVSFISLTIAFVLVAACSKPEDSSTYTPTAGVVPQNPSTPYPNSPSAPLPQPGRGNYPPVDMGYVSAPVPYECQAPVTNQTPYGVWKRAFTDRKGINYFVELKIFNGQMLQRLRCSLPQTQRWIDTNVKSRIEVRFNQMNILENDVQDLLNDGVGGEFRCYNYIFRSEVSYETRGNNCLVINPGPSADYYIK